MDNLSELKNVDESFQNITLEDIQSRHRRERKDMQGKIQALKKAAPKSDKKKRKEVMEEVERLEKQLEKQHSEEIAQFNQLEKSKQSTTITTTNAAATEIASTNKNTEENNEKAERQQQQQQKQEQQQQEQQHRVSKAQKRRDKKAKETRERENRLQTYIDNIINGPKALETSNLEEKLVKRQLAVYDIESDGNCLYNAVRHQLIQHGLGHYTVTELRAKAANYIEANKAALLPYMTNAYSNDVLSDEEFKKYCYDIRNKSVWGGHIELKALSSTLEIPIEIVQAEGSSTIQGKEYKGTPLIITYHRHMYSMGEHYNSTLPIAEMENNDDVNVNDHNDYDYDHDNDNVHDNVHDNDDDDDYADFQ